MEGRSIFGSLKPGGVIPDLFIKLLPVQIVMMAIGSINSIIDGAAATNFIGPASPAATALFFPLLMLMQTVSTVLLSGSQILCGKLMGREQTDHSAGVFSLDMTLVFGFGALLMLICLLFPGSLAQLLGAEESLEAELKAYILGYAPGIIPFLMVSHLTSFMQMERQEKRTYIGMTVMIVSNVLLDVVFVKVLNLGMFGLGLATSVSNLLYVFILLLYYFSGKAMIRFSLSSVHFADVPEILRIGIPGALSQLAQVLRSMVLNRIMLAYAGQYGVAAFSAVYSFGTVFAAGTMGIANAARLLVSVYAGEEDRAGLITIMRMAVCWGALVNSLFAVVLILCSGLFTSIFYQPNAGEVYTMTHMGFLIFPFSIPCSCIFCSYVSYYQSMGRMKIVNLLSVMDGVVGVILFSLILTPFIGMNGVWLAHVLNGVLIVLTVMVCVRVLSGSFPRNMEDTLLFPDHFGVQKKDRMQISVNRMEDVINISENVVHFCREHGLDRKRGMYAGLAVEEMCGNILQHGFSDGKRHHVDVRVILREEDVMIRLKDDCPAFNPKEIERLFDPEDPSHNVGIRLVFRISREMTYQNTLGLNVLTMVL